MNIAEVILKLQDLSEGTFDKETFPIRLIEAYAPPKATLAKLRQGSLNKAARPGELLWAKKLHFRPAERNSAGEALDVLLAEWTGKKSKPRLLLSSDGQDVVAIDTKTDDQLNISFKALTERYDFFLPLAGVERYQGVADSPADIKASGRLAKFYDAILEANPDWTAHGRVHELNLFLTRILLCMFAQSTGIFQSELFSKTLHECTSPDGSDTQEVLQAVFQALNFKPNERAAIPEYARRFPYANGGLFRERTEVPRFSRLARRILIDSAHLNWSEINPDIFGSMIQAIVKPEMREELGLHYTSVPNIMKVLRPLFLESLEEELAAARTDVRRLKTLLERIRHIRVFDPACGSGNFLIIAYKELCKLEIEIFDLLRTLDRQFALPFSGIQFGNFVGIEMEDFAVETAKLSLYIAQHQMNVLFKQKFDIAPRALPLEEGGRIVTANAARRDWAEICPFDVSLESYVVGNPPYLGMTFQNKQQKADVANLFSRLVKGYKELDYVACWFLKASDYCQRGSSKCAFVTTNSICQGELVALLWPLILSRDIEIGFAYQSFKWKNSAAHNAGVICAIVGLRPKSNDRKRLFESEIVRNVKHISPYLIEGDDTIVRKRRKSISGFPYMARGNTPTDRGNLLMSPQEKQQLVTEYPEAAQFLRRYYGSQEFIKGIERWCIWISDDDKKKALSIPEISRRVDQVRATRLESRAPSTVDKANVAHRFIQIQDYGKEAIIVPKVSSERRTYLPVGLVGADVIISDLAFGIYSAPIYLAAILSSRIHMVWVAAAGGRLKTDYRYSNTMVWNTFPLPELSSSQINQLEEGVWSILAEREKYTGRTIAYLYDAATMPTGLLTAHREVDGTLERIYNGRPFTSDTERLEHLFKRYKLMIAKEEAPLLKTNRLPKGRARANG